MAKLSDKIMANTIADKLTYLSGTKDAIKQAIIAKGVEVTDTDTFRSYANKIEAIQAGGGGTGDCSVAACFDEVGYTFVPVYIQKGLETAAQFKAAWNPADTYINMAGYKDSMVFFPKIDASNVTSLSHSFQDSSILVFPNIDFPSLQEDDSTFDYTFNRASRLISIDFGNLGTKTFNMNNTFAYCVNLQRLHVDNGSNVKFNFGYYTFQGCKSLSEDTEQCNIFDFFNYENQDLCWTFQGAKIVRDFNFINPTNLKNCFEGAINEDKNITITFNDLTLDYKNNYFYNFCKFADYSDSPVTLKLTGNLTLDSSTYQILGNAYSYSQSVFNKLDISNFNYTNTSNESSTSYEVSFMDNLLVNEVVGLDTFEETYPNLPSNVKYTTYFIQKLLTSNTLKSFPEGVETYWNKHKNNFDWKFGETDTGILNGLYKIHGTIDLSFLDVQLVATPQYIIYNIGKTPDLVIRLDSMNWSGVTNANNSTLFNSPNVVALYTPFNFDSTTTVRVSGLTNWTDHDSLIWSLLTHSTDRTAQGLGTQTIKLSKKSYNALTADEISQIEAKGYTLTQQ